MSQYFRVGKRVLWNPSNDTADVFACLVSGVAELVCSPSGIVDLGAGEYEISLPEFSTTSKLATERFSATSHPLFRGMLASFLPICLVLIFRADQDPSGEEGEGVSVDNSGLVREVLSLCDEQDRSDLLAAARDYQRFMPR